MARQRKRTSSCQCPCPVSVADSSWSLVFSVQVAVVFNRESTTNRLIPSKKTDNEYEDESEFDWGTRRSGDERERA